jgi:hypothetical protein
MPAEPAPADVLMVLAVQQGWCDAGNYHFLAGKSAVSSCRGVFRGERRRDRAKPSSNGGQYCGLETAITAS